MGSPCETQRTSAFILRALHYKQQSPQSGSLTDSEQTLLTACEFWLACGNSTLRSYLGTQPKPRLESAKVALIAIGALDAARLLNGCSGASSAIRNIENGIRITNEDVEAYLVSFAALCCIDETGFAR